MSSKGLCPTEGRLSSLHSPQPVTCTLEAPEQGHMGQVALEGTQVIPVTQS